MHFSDEDRKGAHEEKDPSNPADLSRLHRPVIPRSENVLLLVHVSQKSASNIKEILKGGRYFLNQCIGEQSEFLAEK
jgi:hypothetical protein